MKTPFSLLYLFTLAFGALFFLTSCSSPNKPVVTDILQPPSVKTPLATEEPKLEEIVPATPPAEPVMPATGLKIIGEVEPVTLVEAKMTLPARIDTGATTSSLDAADITRMERDGKPWVRFTVSDRKTKKTHTFEARIKRVVEIKRHGTDPQKRLSVNLKIKLGGKNITEEFTLADRSSFEYPILVGRNLLKNTFVVDVSKKNTTSQMAEE